MYWFDLLKTFHIKYLFLSICMLVIRNTAKEFNYGDEGPDSWPYDVEPQCGGQRQSPIDIQKGLSTYDPGLVPLVFTGYDTSSTFNASNNGHTVQFTAMNTNMKLNGSDFVQTYTLSQFHFHWGENNYQGSEHMLDGSKFPLELHLVHKASNGDIAVLGVFFDLSESNNSALNSVLDAVGIASSESLSTTVNLVLSSFLPTLTKLSNYYRYTGSLTTPPCTEGVIWTIFEDHIPISKNQMASFHQNIIMKNFRYTQKLNSRGVFTSMKISNKLTDYEILARLLNNSNRVYVNPIILLSLIFILFPQYI